MNTFLAALSKTKMAEKYIEILGPLEVIVVRY